MSNEADRGPSMTKIAGRNRLWEMLRGSSPDRQEPYEVRAKFLVASLAATGAMIFTPDVIQAIATLLSTTNGLVPSKALECVERAVQELTDK